jgi:hypothetical protein
MTTMSCLDKMYEIYEAHYIYDKEAAIRKEF